MRSVLLRGAVLGVLILGVGGRLAMRGVTLWEGRAHQLTAAGTITVLLWGTGFGIAGALLRWGLGRGFDRWLPGVRPGMRLLAFSAIVLALTLALLTPLTMHRVVLFVPLAVLYVVALWSLGGGGGTSMHRSSRIDRMNTHPTGA